MSLASRRELIKIIRQRYSSGNRKEKKQILDELVATAGYHRKYAINLLRSSHLQTSAEKKRCRKRVYADDVRAALVIIWHSCNRLCSKRLAPFLPEFISTLERFGHLSVSTEVRDKLLAMSPATIDRLLADQRRARGRSLSTTRPGALIKQQIPIRTFADWDDLEPGFLEADTVAHCGTSTHGAYLSTLVFTDVATTWTECFALVCHDNKQIEDSLRLARRLLPFPLKGLDTDNGSEFINYNLLKYCRRENITFTRCRPYKKNDQCRVEQKNGALVRRIVGYDRFEGDAACRQLASLYGVLRLYTNFFQPSVKLISKERHPGGKVARKYDTAQTPYSRVLDSPQVSGDVKAQLRSQYSRLDPIALLRQLECYQDSLWQYAWRPAEWTASDLSAVAIGLPASIHLTDPGNSEPQASEPEERTYRRSGNGSKHHLVQHTWRTRADPFVLVSEQIEQHLRDNPHLCAKALLRTLQQQYPGQFTDGHLRTLQRRVKEWRDQSDAVCDAVISPSEPVGAPIPVEMTC